MGFQFVGSGYIDVRSSVNEALLGLFPKSGRYDKYNGYVEVLACEQYVSRFHVFLFSRDDLVEVADYYVDLALTEMVHVFSMSVPAVAEWESLDTFGRKLGKEERVSPFEISDSCH